MMSPPQVPSLHTYDKTGGEKHSVRGQSLIIFRFPLLSEEPSFCRHACLTLCSDFSLDVCHNCRSHIWQRWREYCL